MHHARIFKIAIAFISPLLMAGQSSAFEGRISATITQGNESSGLLYTAGTNSLRVEMTATNWPNPVDILDRNSGQLTLLFPHNRSYVRLRPAQLNPSAPAGLPQMPGGLPPGSGPANLPGMPAPPPISLPPNMPAPPPGVGPQARANPDMPAMPPRPVMPNVPVNPPGVGPQMSAGPGAPGMPSMPMMPPPMMENMELKATGEKTNLLGFACEKFELKQRGETMEIWATDQLLPFQNYVRNEPHRFGPRMIEEQWAGMLTAKRLFPMRASLRYDNGTERYRFEVQSVTPQKLTDEDAKLFEPPAGYIEVEPLPF